MTHQDQLEELLARHVAHYEASGQRLSAGELCAGQPDQELVHRLEHLIERYHSINFQMMADTMSAPAPEARERAPAASAPQLEGFRTVERIGGGGMGDVYKLEDLELGRMVAGKVLRSGLAGRQGLQAFLKEARALALFKDPSIVTIHGIRADSDPPVLIMELVEGFELGKIGRSLERSQQVRILVQVCEAMQRAHDLGIQHRDLKPSNILLDAALAPKIVDFGLAESDPDRGHWSGTLPYMAPEQLTQSAHIDARVDIYALGIILYELLCNRRPYEGDSSTALIAEIRRAEPRLPVELDPGVAEPLQAVALKAMDPDPGLRYQSAADMAADLGRFLDGHPVLARPTQYNQTLARKLEPHIRDLEEWEEQKLIYPHETTRLKSQYHKLQARDEDWIVAARKLTLPRVSLYLGALLLALAGLGYLSLHMGFDKVEGLAWPTCLLLLPFLAASAGGAVLYRREARTAAVAFWLGSLVLLPCFLIITFHELGWSFGRDPDDARNSLAPLLSNRQCLAALLPAILWTVFLAERTRTVALGIALCLFLWLSGHFLLADLGVAEWIDADEWHRAGLVMLALGLPQIPIAYWLEKRGKGWFSLPLYFSGLLACGLALEIGVQEGGLLQAVGVSHADLAENWRIENSDGALQLDITLLSLVSMSANGLLFFLAGNLLEKRGTDLMRLPASLLVLFAPFATLEPIFCLCASRVYAPGYDWVYLGLSLVFIFSSYWRQKRSFYYAGMINTAGALILIVARRPRLHEPEWVALAILLALTILATSSYLDHRARLHRKA